MRDKLWPMNERTLGSWATDSIRVGGHAAGGASIAKVRTGPPIDAAEDYALPVWAGEIPLQVVAAPAIPDPQCSLDLSIPDYALNYSRHQGAI